MIISNDDNPLVDCRWGRVEGQETSKRTSIAHIGDAMMFGKESFITKFHEQYCMLRNKTNYEHLSQFVIPNWGTQSVF